MSTSGKHGSVVSPLNHPQIVLTMSDDLEGTQMLAEAPAAIISLGLFAGKQCCGRSI